MKPDRTTSAGLAATYALSLAAAGAIAAGALRAACGLFLAALATIALTDWRHNRQEERQPPCSNTRDQSRSAGQ